MLNTNNKKKVILSTPLFMEDDRNIESKECLQIIKNDWPQLIELNISTYAFIQVRMQLEILDAPISSKLNGPNSKH